MDADITSADALSLDRIRTQTARDSAADLKAYRTQYLAITSAFTAWFKAAFESLPPELPDNPRRVLTLALAEKYMTTSTAVDPALVLADAVKDAARLKAAVDEVLKLLP